MVAGRPLSARWPSLGSNCPLGEVRLPPRCRHAGAVVGPLLGLALYELLDHRLRPLFFLAVVPALASVVLIALVRERRTAPPPTL